jgi:site-specific DNA recombinase
MSDREWLWNNRSGLAILRVSSQKQLGGISHETQEAEIKNYCKRYGIELVDVRRIVESAKDSDDRKKYSAAIKHALANDVKHLLFYMYDRESRNLTDNETNEKLVKNGLIVIHYVRENKVLHKDSPDSEFFIRDVQAAANKQFIRNLTAKTLDALKQKAEGGWFPSNRVPLGYIVQKITDSEGKLMKRGSIVVVDPNQSRVRWVQREFELRAEGYSYEQIRNQIVSEGLVPPDKISQYRKPAIEKRLQNPFYEGKFIWQGKTYEGKHPVIIPVPILAQARNRKKGLRLVRTDNRGVFGGGFILCGSCGCAIVFDPKRKKTRSGKVTDFPYYHCTNGRKLHASLQGLHVHERILWEQFDRAVDSIQISPALAAAVSEALNDTYRSHVALSSVETEKARARLADLLKLEDLAMDHLMTNTLDQESFKRQIGRIRTERESLNKKIETLRSQMTGSFRETTESILELCKNAKTLYLSRAPQERRLFLEKILSNPLLTGLTLEYQLRKPFGVLAIINQNEEWRRHVDDFRTQCASLLTGGDPSG